LKAEGLLGCPGTYRGLCSHSKDLRTRPAPHRRPSRTGAASQPPSLFYRQLHPPSHWPLFIAHSFHWAGRGGAGRAPRHWPGPGLPPFCLASGRQSGAGLAGLRRGCSPQRPLRQTRTCVQNFISTSHQPRAVRRRRCRGLLLRLSWTGSGVVV